MATKKNTYVHIIKPQFVKATGPRTHLWPDARYIHRKRTTKMVSKKNSFFSNKRVIRTLSLATLIWSWMKAQGQIWPHQKIPSPWIPIGWFTSQTSRINNKRVISTFKFGYPHLTLKEGPGSNRTTLKDSKPMISYRLVSHCKPLGPIISEL